MSAGAREPTAADRERARQIVAACQYRTPAACVEVIAGALAELRERAEQADARAQIEAGRVRELEAVVALAEHDRDAAFERMQHLAGELERAHEGCKR